MVSDWVRVGTVEDFREGRPATLVLSLALFGGALILAARVKRRAR